MQYLYNEQGSHSVKISKEKRKLQYYKKFDKIKSDNIIGFLDIQKLGKKKREETENNVKIGNTLYPITKNKNPTIHKKFYGYLPVENEESKISYIALYGKRKWFLGLGLSSSIYVSSLSAGSVIAASALALTVIIVSQTVFVDQTERPREKKQVEKTIEKEKIQHGGDSEGVIDYNGAVIVNSNENPQNALEQKGTNFYELTLYSSFMLKQGEPLPLINELPNDVQFEYIITDLNNNIILDKWVAPGKVFLWVPNFPQGEHKLIMNINVWTMDKKTHWLGGTSDITITIMD